MKLPFGGAAVVASGAHMTAAANPGYPNPAHTVVVGGPAAVNNVLLGGGNVLGGVGVGPMYGGPNAAQQNLQGLASGTAKPQFYLDGRGQIAVEFFKILITQPGMRVLTSDELADQAVRDADALITRLVR